MVRIRFLDTPLENAFAPRKKPIVPALIAAGGTVLGSLIGGIFGSSGQSSANAANLQATRETNAQNYKMFQEQLGWNEKMWNEQNLYNTPSEQMKRYIDAGINPYMAMDNISAGNAEAVQSASPNPAVTPAPMQNAMAPMASAIGQAIPTALNAVSMSLSNKEKAIDLVTRQQENAARVNQLLKAGVLSDSEAAYYQGQTNRIGALLPYEVKQMDKHLSLTDAQINEASERVELMKLQRIALDYDNKYIKPAQLNEINQRIWKMAEDVRNGRITASAAASQAAAAIIGANAQQTSSNAAMMNAATHRNEYFYMRDALRDEIKTRARLNEWNASPEVSWDAEAGSPSAEVGIPGVGKVTAPGGRVKAHGQTRLPRKR